MSLSQSYSVRDVIHWYDQQEIQKAKAYLNSISHLRIQPDKITAEVKGASPRPYFVEIFFDAGKAGDLRIDPTCSCPVRWKCKHTAAVLLSALSLPRAPTVNHAVLEWVESFRRAVKTPPKKTAKPAVKPEKLCYVLTKSAYTGSHVFGIYKGKLDDGGRLLGRLEEWSNVERALVRPPQFVTEEDLTILRLLWKQRDKHDYFSVRGAQGNEILTRLLASGRLFFMESLAGSSYLKTEPVLLKQGKARKAHLEWGADDSGKMVPRVVSNASIEVFPFNEATWYADAGAGEIGQLKMAQSPVQIVQLLNMPPLAEIDVQVVSEVLREMVPDLPPPSTDRLRVIETTLIPVLLLDTSKPSWMGSFRGYRYGTQKLDFARVKFRYGDAALSPGHPGEFVTLQNGETVRVTRDQKSEKHALKSLGGYGLEELSGYGTPDNIGDRPIFVLESEKSWPSFMQQAIPQMREAGWEIAVPQGFRHHVLEVEAWEAEFGEEEDGWFSLNMGIVVNGQRLPLAPMLHALFRVDPRWLDASQLGQTDDDEQIELLLKEGGRVHVPAGRIKPLARTLIELFDGRADSKIRLSRYDVARIGELSGMERWQFKGMDAVMELANKLKNTAGIKAVSPPDGFALQLRPYQLEGLSWLQYLREQELAGILADDMGLGKTAQALAHLLLEKQSGRTDKPSLVVLPTSLIFNWKRETERFAPQLKLLSLHGKERAEHFPTIPEHDVVITTYPLLWRDEKALAEHDYHLLILDEAQTVKNVSSQAAQVVRKLNARHRLCLTGTPLENHLGELWAQFDFLLPGLLGDAKQFTKTWRTPIEKQGNKLRRDLLAKRVKPFILRRRKEDVALELPPKTFIIRTVELEGGQRDLYETVRTAMDQRVREEIAAKGFARSHIIILDALLKLRQVCCDPRLLKLTAAKKVKERAKLDMLMEMLPELVSEGRRILVFSQFTSMLELIETDLASEKLGYVKLTGDTQNREEVVRRFQDGEVPIFLISLKAGGVGLNLTAADTVIHYDPWWNPAVENQATDRAHRLGQTKNVFVYKLVVAGSIEEKILALQEKKAELAASILSEDVNGLVKFGEADIAALLAPLPDDDDA
ncbi:MAG: DEAD/DEAH box helicase family protein [Nitrosomonadales bacterium]|nr:DEAD/DEAH box helicase family protein [Nitrosomonadales bacterium]